MTKIKICGLTRTEDIDIVNEFLPDFFYVFHTLLVEIAQLDICQHFFSMQ